MAQSVIEGVMRVQIRLIVAIGAFILLGLAVILFLVAESPPAKIRLATGLQGGAYEIAAEQIKEILARSGVSVELVHTRGSDDNLDRLTARDGGAIDAAILQSGFPGAEKRRGIANLGAIFFEPIWLFGRDLPSGDDLLRLRGKRVAAGNHASEFHGLAYTLLADNGLGPKDLTLVPLGAEPAADALIAGKVDAAWIVGGVESAWVQRLLDSPGLELVSFSRAEAYARHHSFLLDGRLTQGAINLGRNIPPQDVQLVGPTAQLVVREDLHPALQSLLLDAMHEAFSRGDAVSAPGLFPNKNAIDIPLSEEARRYYASGPTFFRRVLPYWLANLAERAILFLVPVLTLLVPLLRSLPPIYNWRIRERISGLYHQLRLLEARAREARTASEREEICEKLTAMMHRAAEIRIPLSFADDIYRLRAHIRFVLDTVQHGTAAETSPSG
jgi:TRAP transporter TAXI family solute receptor